MQNVAPSYERIFETSDSTNDFKGHLKLSSLLQFFQDVATFHASELNCGYEAMRERGYFWVLSRVGFEILKRPEKFCKLSVRTFPEKPLPVQCYRNYTVSGASGARLINGSSMWCVLDVEKNRITPIRNIQLYDPTEYFTKDFECPLDKILLEEPGKLVYVKKIRASDLDVNIHMNNTRYGEVLEDAFSLEELREKDFVKVQINYLAQSREGDEISVYRTQLKQNEYLVEGRLQDGTACFSSLVTLG